MCTKRFEWTWWILIFCRCNDTKRINVIINSSHFYNSFRIYSRSSVCCNRAHPEREYQFHSYDLNFFSTNFCISNILNQYNTQYTNTCRMSFEYSLVLSIKSQYPILCSIWDHKIELKFKQIVTYQSIWWGDFCLSIQVAPRDRPLPLFDW